MKHMFKNNINYDSASLHFFKKHEIINQTCFLFTQPSTLKFLMAEKQSFMHITYELSLK